jgi:DNA primase small subunit
MGEKGWRGSDLIFDLDADHLPSVDPETDEYAEMLAACKEALVRLLAFLEDDFGFDEPTVVFSGGRGYHVHVRDEQVRDLDRGDRREIAGYVRGPDLEFDDLVRREAVGGMGMKNPTYKRSLPTDGGWGARVHDHLMALVDEIGELPEAEALARLREFDGIGEGKAGAILANARENYDELAGGNVDVHPAVVSLAKLLFERALAEDAAPIDEPVTTDVNRLIRLPGSLHGGSGLRVTPIDREDLADFDPLVDAVPETFQRHEIAVKVAEGGRVDFGGDSFTIAPGADTVPEALGVFLMARGRAEKAPE